MTRNSFPSHGEREEAALDAFVNPEAETQTNEQQGLKEGFAEADFESRTIAEVLADPNLDITPLGRRTHIEL